MALVIVALPFTQGAYAWQSTLRAEARQAWQSAHCVGGRRCAPLSAVHSLQRWADSALKRGHVWAVPRDSSGSCRGPLAAHRDAV